MFSPVLRNWLIALMSVGSVATFAVGCGKTDLDGYRLAKDHSAEPSLPADPLRVTSPQVDTPDSPGEPPAASTDELAAASAIVPVNVAESNSVKALMSVPADELNLAPKADASASTPASENSAVASSESPKIEVLVKEKTFRTDRKTGALKVTYDDLDLLRVLNMDQVTDDAVSLMPDWLRNLDGKTISLRGVMFPQFDSEGIERFVLARDSQACCFGPNARIYHLVDVTMKPGKSTSFIPHTRFFDVVGRFHIELSGQDGKQFGLYYIDQAEVIDR